jgi:hypothetical protein
MKSIQERTASIALFAWGGITLLVVASILLIRLRWGAEGFSIFIQEGIYTHLRTTLASVAITWLLAGWFLYLVYSHKINASNALTWIGFFLVAFLYLNILRERFRYGDIDYYIQAATRLYNNQPLQHTYLYPPLWATLLEFIVPLGEEGILLVAWIFNVLAVFVFYFLLHRVLENYGFSARLAAIVTAGFMLINTPILRTLVYVQVNLHTTNAIFLGLILYNRSKFLSALMMALAVQLKASPVVLALAFLLTIDLRWLAWFVVNSLIVASITLFTNGLSPFLDFLHNSSALTLLRTSMFHDTSFDSLFSFPTQVFAFPELLAQILIYSAKVLLILVAILVLINAIRSGAFYPCKDANSKLYNAFPSLLILMILASPVVWEHHGLFVSLSFLVLLKKMESPLVWMLFGFAYFLEFLLPTFDFYPWSYGRLVAPLICLGILWTVSIKPGNSSFYERINHWASALPGLPPAQS